MEGETERKKEKKIIKERARAREGCCLGMSRVWVLRPEGCRGGSAAIGFGEAERVSHTFPWRGFRMQIPPRGFFIISILQQQQDTKNDNKNWNVCIILTCASSLIVCVCGGSSLSGESEVVWRYF